MLQHDRFFQVFPGVYRTADTILDASGLLHAARLALPADARPSHLTRLVALGLDYGPFLPMHFTVARDLHLAIADVFLHRTVRMPPTDEHGVSVEAAFIGAASHLRLIDLVKIGDWLLHRGHLDVSTLRGLAMADDWRPGSSAALAVIPHLDGRSRSLPESETRLVLIFAGLPVPEVNVDVFDGSTFLGCGDLVYRWCKLLLEYEGRQHAFDTNQFDRDIHRYAGFRGADWEYAQVTKAKLDRPKALVLDVYRLLVLRGYDGPAPRFGRRWRSLFRRPRPASVFSQPHEHVFG